jgi:hypothetical protein
MHEEDVDREASEMNDIYLLDDIIPFFSLLKGKYVTTEEQHGESKKQNMAWVLFNQQDNVTGLIDQEM